MGYVGGTANVAGLVWLALMTSYSWAYAAESTEDEAIEEIERKEGGNDEPDAKINVTKKDGVEIRSKEKPVKLASGSPKKKDKNAATLELAKNQIELKLKKAGIWITEESDILLENNKSSNGEIQLTSKGKIWLNSKANTKLQAKGDIIFKSKSLNHKNFKVTG